MKKIVILGCENSHADLFLSFIQANKKFSDVQVLGVYSEERAAAEALKEKYGVPVMDSYDQFVNEADGVINTARHGDNHYKYVAPYLKKGIPMFIDKPITITEGDALKLISEAKEHGVKLTGGSCLRHDGFVQEIKRDVLGEVDGKTHGGLVRAPLSSNNPNGGFFFYVQHLVEMLMEAFGRYPKSVKAFKTNNPKKFENGDDLTVVVRYDTYDIVALGGELVFDYHISRCSDNKVKGFSFQVGYDRPCFFEEFDEFYDMLNGAESTIGYKDFIAPVFVMNAIKKSLDSGKEVPVAIYQV